MLETVGGAECDAADGAPRRHHEATGIMKLGGPLLLVGCGKMGSALLDGWLSRGLSPAAVWIVEPNAAALQGEIARGVHHAADAARPPAALQPAPLVFAVQPQLLAAAPHRRRAV